MPFNELNLVIFTVSLTCGYILWFIAKMWTKPSNSFSGNKVSTWWMTRKIKNWKKENKINDECDEQLENKRVNFFGCSQDGAALFIEIYTFEEQCEGYFILKLKNGILLQQPVATVTKRSHPDSISVGNLTIQRIEPFSKWRITFNGMLELKDNSQTNENLNDDVEHHVMFTFFWSAASDPLKWPNSVSPKLLSGADIGVTDIENHLHDLLTTDDGFDQFGSLFGQVTIERDASKDVFEMNLPGMRKVRHVKENQTTVYQSLESWKIIGVCKDGFVFTLSAKEIDNCQKVYSGCVRMPNNSVHTVHKTNLSFDFDSRTIQDRKEFSFSFKANNETFHAQIKMEQNSKATFHSCEALKTQQYFSLVINDRPGYGVLLSRRRTSNHKKLQPLESMIEPSSTLEQHEIRKIKSLMLNFNEAEAQIEELSGGKGASLAYLTQLAKKTSTSNFIVPQGFILTTNSFNLQLKRNKDIQKALEHLEDVAYHRAPETLESATETVQNLFMGRPLEKEIVADVKRAYEVLLNDSVGSLKLAVRSSAVGEDGLESSSAGQNETFLGVHGLDQVLDALQKCWASLFSVQSVTYRVQNIQPVRAEMSVVVQMMIPSECAGVLFTNHPVNNDPSKLLITANYGLGESVVSGLVDPDVFVIQHIQKNNNLKIFERKLGNKTHFVHMTSDSKVANVELKDVEKQKLCLTDANLLRLCEVGLYLQESYGSPRDIEWAIYKEKLYLLQSRPMTSTNAFSSWELLHEFDSAVMSDEDLFSFVNVGEVMPEAMTPLTASALVPAFENGLMKNFPGATERKYFNQLMGVSHFRIAMDVFSAFLRLNKKEVSLENRAHGIAIFGHEFVTDEILRIAIHRYGVASKLLEMRFLWFVIKAAWVGKKTVSELDTFMDEFIGTYSRRNLRGFPSLLDIYEDMTEKLDEKFNYVQSVHGNITMLTTCYQIFMYSTLSEGRNELTPEFLNDVAILLSSCKDAESAEIPVLLDEIVRTMFKCNTTKAQEFSNINPHEGVEWLRNNCIVAYTLFEIFIDKNSHRGFQEFDFGYETWGMNPALVIEMLQSSIKCIQATGAEREVKPKRTNEEILAELKTPTRSSTRKVIGYFLPKCQTYVQLRERTKSMLIAYINELRKAYYYLGEKMQMQGYLPDYELIFFLSHREIGTVLREKSRSAHLINKAIRRRRLFPEWKKLSFAEFQWGLMKPKEEITVSNDMDTKVTGTPVCEGIVTGRACVVKSFSEVSKIKSGDILIAYSTDIAWSPYFPILRGVVTELGGLISHGAVVAREYGLPCIVGATNATSLISDGDHIRMNANTGIIVKVNADRVKN